MSAYFKTHPPTQKLCVLATLVCTPVSFRTPALLLVTYYKICIISCSISLAFRMYVYTVPLMIYVIRKERVELVNILFFNVSD